MYVIPNSTIKVLARVPLDSKYKNTIYFPSRSAQQSYFANKFKYNFTEYTRIKEQKSVRVEMKADNLYDCNYLMYQNTSYGSKWFYAFITSVEYINDKTTEIHFELDVMQTWLVEYDYDIKPSFVEREHSLTDKAGDNIVSEPIDFGNIVCSNIVSSGKFDSYVAVIATAWLPEEQTGGYVSGLFSGLSYVAGSIDTPADVQTLLDLLQAHQIANQIESIVSIFVMPTAFYTDNALPVVETAKLYKNTMIDGYTPRNKKLLTYPYNFLGVDSGDNSAIYRYEYFEDKEECNFTMNGCVTPNPEIQLVPLDYNGSNFNYVEKLMMAGFPQVGFAIDGYRAWLAQEATGQLISVVGSAGTVALGAVSGVAPVAVGGVVGLASGINNMMTSANKPSQAKGSNGTSVSVATRTKDFWFKRMHVTSQYAKIIDDYFDMFGYATNRVKVPNISTRPHWNYVKTNDVCLVGSVPADDMERIQKIYNSGITFWKYGNEVGNYGLDNTL